MSKQFVCLIVFSTCIASTALGQSNSAVWPVSSGGNGHRYEVISAQAAGGINWADAQADALSRGGYLATLTSAAENNFVFDSVVNDGTYWQLLPVNNSGNLLFGPWFGGLQPDMSAEPAGGWEWVNGDGTFASTYTNWGASEPSNSDGNTGAPEDRVHFFAGSRTTPLNEWNDADGINLFPSYVVEFNVPEPSTLAMVGVALTSWGFLGRRRG